MQIQTVSPCSSDTNRALATGLRHCAILEKASIQLNGSSPWDMQLKTAGVPEQALLHGNLGLGEAYMAGAWEAGELDEFSTRLTDHIIPPRLFLHMLRARSLNRQNREPAKDVGIVHYDLGHDFYAVILDPRMTSTPAAIGKAPPTSPMRKRPNWT